MILDGFPTDNAKSLLLFPPPTLRDTGLAFAGIKPGVLILAPSRPASPEPFKHDLSFASASSTTRRRLAHQLTSSFKEREFANGQLGPVLAAGH